MKVSALKTEMDGKFTAIDKQFEQVDNRLERVDDELKELQQLIKTEGDATRRELRQLVKAEGETTRRHFDVVAEKITDERNLALSRSMATAATGRVHRVERGRSCAL